MPDLVRGRVKGLFSRDTAPFLSHCPVSRLSSSGVWDGVVVGEWDAVCLRLWTGQHKLWPTPDTLDTGLSPTASLASALPRTRHLVQDRTAEVQKGLPLALGPAPVPLYLFVLSLDFGNNGKPSWMFVLWGRRAAALVPAPSLPEGSLEFAELVGL